MSTMRDLLLCVHVVISKIHVVIWQIRQSIELKCVPHVQYDNFSLFNQSDDCFLASSLPLLSSLHIIRRVSIGNRMRESKIKD